jgi:hypothetical protein
MIIDNETLAAALLGYEAELAKIEQKRLEIRTLLGIRSPGRPRIEVSPHETTPVSTQTRRKMSASTKKRMAAAQRRRWAAVKASKNAAA